MKVLGPGGEGAAGLALATPVAGSLYDGAFRDFYLSDHMPRTALRRPQPHGE